MADRAFLVSSTSIIIESLSTGFCVIITDAPFANAASI